MKIGVLGTGVVGEAIATALINKEHQVMMGSRQAGNEKAEAWKNNAGNNASAGTFAETTLYGELIFSCLNGEYALEAIGPIKTENLDGKVLIDVTNPLDFTHGMPPRILENFGNSKSLGEEIQKLARGAFVIKTLNTVNYNLMVDARKVNNGDHNLFICGNDVNAKNKAKHFLVDNFHWRADRLIDLGGIESARAIEAIVPFWVLVYQALGTPLFNFKIVS
ncbi:MAG: NADPH-dependent F420 reductase [Chitinophagaceae bacterium]